MKKFVLAFLFLAAAYLAMDWQVPARPPTSLPETTVARKSTTPSAAQWQSGQQVQGRGVVSRILADDNNGSRHQRFIIEIASGTTLLVAHNIDLAPRVPSLREGDTVEFYGEYETNDRGGVIHWTHHDPQKRHIDGWLEHQGRRYQ